MSDIPPREYLFIHLSTDGHLSPPTPPLFAIINNAAGKFVYKVLSSTCFQFFWAYEYLGAELLGPVPTAARVAAPFHSAAGGAQGFPFLCVLLVLFLVSDVRRRIYHRKTSLSYRSPKDLFWHVLLLKWFTSEKHPQMEWLESWMSHRTPKA